MLFEACIEGYPISSAILRGEQQHQPFECCRVLGLIPLRGNRMGMHAPAANHAAKDALAAISSRAARNTSTAVTASVASSGALLSTGQHIAPSQERLARFLNIFEGAPDWLKHSVAAHPDKLSENAELRRPASKSCCFDVF